MSWRILTKTQQHNLLLLIVKAYCNAVATLFGGFLNTEASALRLNNKGKGGDIDWDHFVRLHSHKQELVPQFCEAKYRTTTLSRKWSEVRTKRTGVRNCLKMQLEQQLKGIKNVDIKDIMDKFHLSHGVSYSSGFLSRRVYSCPSWRACTS